MVKVSITLPNAAQITFESQEPELIHQVVEMVLRDLPRDLMHFSAMPEGATAGSGLVEKGSNVTDSTTEGTPRAPRRRDVSASISDTEKGNASSVSMATPAKETAPLGSHEDRDAFAVFCRSSNSLGDMRRVVVAVEGANRFFHKDGVDASDLADLFDLAGWRHPHNFTQTLRNAARTKFRWLERLPGRDGRYTATDVGRAVTLGE